MREVSVAEVVATERVVRLYRDSVERMVQDWIELGMGWDGMG